MITSEYTDFFCIKYFEKARGEIVNNSKIMTAPTFNLMIIALYIRNIKKFSFFMGCFHQILEPIFIQSNWLNCVSVSVYIYAPLSQKSLYYKSVM